MNACLAPEMTDRKQRLALLARAEIDELAEPLGTHWPDEEVRDLRKPESGLVMLRGRIGGDGAPFNFGEATMSRAAVELHTGHRGFGQCLGRNTALARMIAIFDAIAEREPAAVESAVLSPIRRRLSSARQQRALEVAATKVDFYTLVRGDPDA